jgi:Cys-tRNA synthase (O-phospho-L-seryl-tRNA:Cys-tRNA synthase)
MQAYFVSTLNNYTIDKQGFSCYIITMTEEQKREEQRKVKNRVQRWNESVEKVKTLVKEWKKNQR